jgi:hypothetical protein
MKVGAENVGQKSLEIQQTAKSLHKIRRTIIKIQRIFAQNLPDQLGSMVYTIVLTQL